MFGMYQLEIFAKVLYLMVNYISTDFVPTAGTNET